LRGWIHDRPTTAGQVPGGDALSCGDRGGCLWRDGVGGPPMK
jgi:hypothetical protein